ncbi:MAG: DUF3368 domain-containing protein [Bacteroidota bacterium]
MVVVSDTTVISNLLHINKISWLQDLFDEVLIPPSVARELAVSFGTHPTFPLQEPDSWLLIRVPQNLAGIQSIRSRLDQGEAEAIILALEHKADFLLVDELLGRKEAMKKGLRVLGTLGILMKAKQMGLTKEIRPLMDRLIEKGFWLHPSLYQEVLKDAGEST